MSNIEQRISNVEWKTLREKAVISSKGMPLAEGSVATRYPPGINYVLWGFLPTVEMTTYFGGALFSFRQAIKPVSCGSRVGHQTIK